MMEDWNLIMINVGVVLLVVASPLFAYFMALAITVGIKRGLERFTNKEDQ